MAKTRLGFDIGSNSIKITVSGNKPKFYEIRMPDNIMKDGEIAMPHALSEFIKKERKRLKIPKGACGLVLPASQAICRTVTLPRMTKDQLMLNLPYEFSEFINDDPDKFYCDYAMCEEDETDKAPFEPAGKDETSAGENASESYVASEVEQMTLMAAAASKSRITQYIHIFSNAGLKLDTLLPGEMSLIQLTKRYCEHHPENVDEFCFVDLGQSTVRITIVKRDQIQAERQIEPGCSRLDLAIADALVTDPYIACSYKTSNYQSVLELPECMEIYQQIAIEILRVIHFYRFKYRDSYIRGLYLIGRRIHSTASRQNCRDACRGYAGAVDFGPSGAI